MALVFLVSLLGSLPPPAEWEECPQESSSIFKYLQESCRVFFRTIERHLASPTAIIPFTAFRHLAALPHHSALPHN